MAFLFERRALIFMASSGTRQWGTTARAISRSVPACFDPKHAGTDREIARAVVPHCRVPLEAMKINARRSNRNAIEFGFLPGDRKGDRCIQDVAEVECIIRVLPEVVAFDLNVPAECLL